jgi:hypothetical protein
MTTSPTLPKEYPVAKGIDDSLLSGYAQETVPGVLHRQ